MKRIDFFFIYTFGAKERSKKQYLLSFSFFIPTPKIKKKKTARTITVVLYSIDVVHH